MIIIFKMAMRATALLLTYVCFCKHFGGLEGATAVLALYALLPEHRNSL